MKAKIQAKYYKPFFFYFYKRVREIIPKDVHVSVGDFVVRDKPFTQCDTSVLIGISGSFLVGRSIMSMDTRVAIEIAEIMSGQPIDSFADDAQSAICELMNIIVGNAVSTLGLTFEQIKFTPPKLFYGRAVKTSINESSLTIMRQMTTGWGNIEFNTSLDFSTYNKRTKT